MKRIPLTQGEFAEVDDDDYEYLRQWNWRVNRGFNKKPYAGRSVPGGKRFTVQLMHRVIMGNPAGKLVDHIDGNGLNNKKSNLRVANRSGNGYNHPKKYKSNTSGVTGVYRCPYDPVKWIARVYIEGRQIALGTFRSKSEAIRVREEAEIKYYGEFTPNKR